MLIRRVWASLRGGGWAWAALGHVASLAAILVVMVTLYTRTCTLDIPQDPPGFQARQSRHKRHVLSADDLHFRPGNLHQDSINRFNNNNNDGASNIPLDLATSNGSFPDIRDVVDLPQRDLLKLLRLPILHDPKYDVIHDSRELCQHPGLEVVVAVPSARYNFEQRTKIRRSTLHKMLQSYGHRIALVFFLGVPPRELRSSKTLELQRKIDMEAEQYGDIVQETYMDTHRTLSTKSVALLRWLAQHCSNAGTVLRLEDDVKFEGEPVMHAVGRAAARHSNFVLGAVYSRRSEVVRDPRSSRFVPQSLYPASHYPPYVLGGLWAAPRATVRLLWEAARRTPRIGQDEVYTTGILATLVNASLVGDPEFSFQHKSCGAIRL